MLNLIFMAMQAANVFYIATEVDTEKGLQESLSRLEEFCSNWDISISIEKTKIVVFNKPT